MPRIAASTALARLRVLDFSRVRAGPTCVKQLADFGADVIKIEQPRTGDAMRHWAPMKKDKSLWWKVIGRNKRLITLSLSHPEGQDLFRRLVKDADIVIENYRPGVLARLGLDWPKLSEINPRLIMLSITGFGETGPKSLQPGFGKIAEGLSGIVPLTGKTIPDSVFVGFSLGDATAAMVSLFAIQLALYHRDINGGRGAHIDLGLYEALFRLLDCQLALDSLIRAMELRGDRVEDGPVYQYCRARCLISLDPVLPHPRQEPAHPVPCGV